MFRSASVVLAGFLALGIAATDLAAQAPQPATCSLPGLAPNATPAPSDADLLAAYNAQSARVHSVEAAASVHGWAGKRREERPGPVLLHFREPAWIRATGAVPYSGKRTFDLLGNGRDFWLVAPDGKAKRLFEGPVDAPAVSSSPQANLRPRPLVDALHWEAGRLDAQQDSRATPGTRTLLLDLPAEPPFPSRTATVAFDLRSGVVTEVDFRDAAQRVDLQLRYGDWQPGEDGICYPRQIAIDQPLDDREFDLQIASLRLNERIAGQEFRMAAPLGVPVTHLAGPAAGTDRQ